MINCIQKGVKASLLDNNKALAGCKFTLTKKRNAINCFQKFGNVDEYELAEELLRMQKANLCGYNF